MTVPWAELPTFPKIFSPDSHMKYDWSTNKISMVQHFSSKVVSLSWGSCTTSMATLSIPLCNANLTRIAKLMSGNLNLFVDKTSINQFSSSHIYANIWHLSHTKNIYLFKFCKENNCHGQIMIKVFVCKFWLWEINAVFKQKVGFLF